MFASCGDVNVIEVGTAITILEKWSTMLRIMSWPLKLGRGLTRSTEMMSHGCKSGVWKCRVVEVSNHDVLFS